MRSPSVTCVSMPSRSVRLTWNGILGEGTVDFVRILECMSEATVLGRAGSMP